MISDQFLQDLKYKIDIEDIVSSYVNLKRAGRNIKGLCPFHSEKTPSFTVYPGTQSFYCFGCGAGGDAITFIKNIENLDYVEAVRFLANRAGMPMPEDVENDKTAQKRPRLLELNRETARFFHSCLIANDGKQALSYLVNRGLSKKTITQFGLGFAPNSWDALINHLKSKGFSEDEMVNASVASRGRSGKLYDEFRNRVIFPIIDLSGNVIGFSGRQLDNKGPKYLNSADTIVFKKSKYLFALNFAKATKTKNIVLCEGNMDVISLHQAGFTNTVAALGTALTDEQARLLSRFYDEVILAYDSDEAGLKATKRARRILADVGLKTKVIKIENAKDPDEYIKKFGATKFKLLLEGSQGALDFEFASLKEKYDITIPSDKTSYINGVVELLATIPNVVEREVYALKTSSETGISKDAILGNVNRLLNQRRKKQIEKEDRELILGIDKNIDKINPQRSRNIKAAVAEENLIISIYKNPNYLVAIEQEISCDDFVTDFGRRVFDILCLLINQKRPLDLSLITKDFDVAQTGYITKLFNSSQGINFDEQETIDFAKTIKNEKYKKTDEQVAQMSNDEFAEYILKMKESKK